MSRPINARDNLPEENDWDGVLGLDVTEIQMLSNLKVMEITEFSTKARRAA